MKELTGKQKRFLRALGTKEDPVVNIGKEGATPEAVKQTQDAIKKRELIKVRVLKNAPEDCEGTIKLLAQQSGADIVQMIGRNGMLFRRNLEKPVIELP